MNGTNFPTQWPGRANDAQGARYAQWSSEQASVSETPFVPAYESARLPRPGQPQPNNESQYSVQDFNAYPQYFYDYTKAKFPLDELGRRFSDPKNVFAIHREISKAIHKEYNIWIAKQEDHLLAEVMIKAYISFFNINHRTGDLEEDLYNLNVMVIKSCVSSMLAALSLQIKQLMMIDRVAIPNPHPVNTSNRGLDGRSVMEMDRLRFLPLAELQPPPQRARLPHFAVNSPAARNWQDQVYDNFRQ